MAPYKTQFDAYALHGRSIVQERHSKKWKESGDQHRSLLTALSQGDIPKPKYQRPAATGQNPVGILGAGIGGLYTALMLKSLGIPYQIIEARNRTGGRIYTHRFHNSGKYDYFDVGAMRFLLPPDSTTPSAMNRLYQLIHYPPLNTTPETGLSSKVIDYHYIPKDNNSFAFFNGIRARSNQIGPHTFDPQSIDVPKEYASVTAAQIVEDVSGPFAAQIVEDVKNGTDTNWKKFRAQYDKYSAWTYMATVYRPSPALGLPNEPLPASVINWCETLISSTSSFTHSFADFVLEYVCFKSAQLLGAKWGCFDGGSQTLSDAVTGYIGTEHIAFNQPITAISGDPKPGTSTPITITTGGSNGRTYHFDSVISTLPLPVLRTLNIERGLLSNLQAMAMRQLQYLTCIKIGVRFKTPWWTTGTDVDGNLLNIAGGLSYTDRPVRVVVYPSYGGDTPSSVLIASYCWATDAEALRALCDAYHRVPIDEVSRKRLEDMVLGDLEMIHNLEPGGLASQVVVSGEDTGFYPWDWTHDVHTMGGTAFFGPGQFEDLYDSMNAPSPNGKLHFAGEALSTRHSWIVGALDSAWRAVSEYLHLSNPAVLPEFYENWGVNEEWTASSVDSELGLTGDRDLILEHLLLHRPELYDLQECT